MFRRFFNRLFTLIALVFIVVILLLFVGNKSAKKSAVNNDKRCISYDGSLEVIIHRIKQNTVDETSRLEFMYADKVIYAEGNDVEFVPSDTYRDAELIHSKTKGIYLIIMPENNSGIAGNYKNADKQLTKETKLPVICYGINSEKIT